MCNLRTALIGVATASFQYDGLGRRVRNTVGSSTTDFFYDGVNPVKEISGGNTTSVWTGLGIDSVISRTEGSAARYLLPNALGSTIALADENGAVQTQYTYEPFGKTSTTGQANTNSYQYTGRENDSTGLYFYRARYYNPTLQRFVSEDPTPA